MSTESEDPQDTVDVCVRLRGRAAARFRRLHKMLADSDDLDHIKLGDLSLSGLAAYGLCEWMSEAERQLGGIR